MKKNTNICVISEDEDVLLGLAFAGLKNNYLFDISKKEDHNYLMEFAEFHINYDLIITTQSIYDLLLNILTNYAKNNQLKTPIIFALPNKKESSKEVIKHISKMFEDAIGVKLK